VGRGVRTNKPGLERKIFERLDRQTYLHPSLPRIPRIRRTPKAMKLPRIVQTCIEIQKSDKRNGSSFFV
jgi:hypothetical protein